MSGHHPRPGNRLCACIAAAAVVALPGCTGMLLGGGGHNDATRLGSDSRSSAQLATDRGITASVQRTLVDDSVLGQYDLQVETVNRRVILHGRVASYEARERAIRLAGDVEGVERVDSRLRVGEGT